MITKEIAAVFALRVYDEDVRIQQNLPSLPYQGWTQLTNPLPVTNGFAYGVFRNQSTGEVVISYRGTDGVGAILGFDGLNNAALSSASPSSQGRQAAQVYAEVLRLYGADAQGSNISFTGHSLGGGLASVMGVWFNRPAIVFDPAPFRPTAQSQERVNEVIQLLGANAPQALKTYNAASSYAARAQQVSGYFAQGEFLGLLRTDASTVNLNAILAQQFGNQNVNGFAMHSQALLTMGLMSSSFKTATVQVQNALPLILSDKLYSQDPKGLETKNFLLDLIRSEQANAGNGKLTHFAADLNKLGTNIAGLNKQAQEAMIAQGIEWYYWQSSNYTGVKEFFTKTGELLQYTTAKGDGLLGALSKAELYTKPWLQAIAAEHGYGSSAGTTAFPAFGTAYDQWNVAAGTTGVTATALDQNKAQIFIGQAGSDTFTGGSKDDVIFAGAGNDTLDGKGGNDKLYGGAGNDTYNFTDAWGKDLVVDADGLGNIQIGGQALGTAQAAGKRNVWSAKVGGGQNVNLSVLDDQSSTTGKTLVITKEGSADNSITIKNFNLTQAEAGGYLGIKLNSSPKLAITAGGGTNVWTNPKFDPGTLAGQSSNIKEGLGKTFSIFLNTAAKAGETLTLALGALADKFKAVLGDRTVAADGAVITLAEGQTQVSFALVQEGEVTLDGSGALSVSYQGTDTNASSNSFALNLQDTGEITRTYTGDQRAKLIGIEIDEHITPDKPSFNTYKWSATSWATDGTLNGGIAEVDFADVIYASSGNDKIDGKGGNDALSGGAGNDQIDGGTGDDMIGGGAGSDAIKGGDGNDYISSSADIQAGRQAYGPMDKWTQWGLPAGTTPEANGTTWGVYKDPNTAELTIWSGITETRTDSAVGDSIDAGAGDECKSSHYKFRSCLRPYLLVKTSIRYRKTASKTLPDACVSRRRARSSIQITPNSIAACARKQGFRGIFDGEKHHQIIIKLHSLTETSNNFAIAALSMHRRAGECV